jgi:hypothetical protein
MQQVEDSHLLRLVPERVIQQVESSYFRTETMNLAGADVQSLERGNVWKIREETRHRYFAGFMNGDWE